ncbi:MAG: methyl-accepting chemotaxis protein, partial [Lysobacteraceae bacterium]
MLDNLTIGKRLGYGFATLAVLLLVIGGFAVHRLGTAQERVRTLTQGEVPAIRDLGRLATLLAEYRVSERGLVASAQDAAKAAEYAGELVTSRQAFETLAASYAARIHDPREQALYADVQAKAARYFDNSRKLVEAIKAGGDMAPAGAAGDLRQAAADAVAALLDHDMERLRTNVVAQEASHRADVWAIATLLLVALALAIAAAVLITRSIVRPLAEVLAVAQAVARGDLERRIPAADRSETGRLAKAMGDMVATLRRFAAAQGEMRERHDAGEISHRIPTDGFEGAYARMAEGVNALVAAHIAIKMRVIDVVSQYARGDLSQDIERYPGEKARITEAVDAVKAGTLAVNAEIKALVDAAVAGDFSRRGDAQRFQFVYRELIEGLNTLMATADGGLAEVGSLLSAVADGDLNRRVDVELPGQFGRLAEDANRTVEQLTQIVAQIRVGADTINAAAGEIASGNNDLSQRTEQQAASLEETASSMEELTSTVKQNADNARQANQLAQGAADVAAQGGSVVGQVVQTMSAISDSSRKIADIIGV